MEVDGKISPEIDDKKGDNKKFIFQMNLKDDAIKFCRLSIFKVMLCRGQLN